MDDFQENSPSKIQVFTAAGKSIFNSAKENEVVRYILLGVFFILIVNAIIVDVLFFSSLQKTSNDNLVLQKISAVCPQSCLGKFSDFVSAVQIIPGQNPATSAAAVAHLTLTPNSFTNPNAYSNTDCQFKCYSNSNTT